MQGSLNDLAFVVLFQQAQLLHLYMPVVFSHMFLLLYISVFSFGWFCLRCLLSIPLVFEEQWLHSVRNESGYGFWFFSVLYKCGPTGRVTFLLGFLNRTGGPAPFLEEGSHCIFFQYETQQGLSGCVSASKTSHRDVVTCLWLPRRQYWISGSIGWVQKRCSLIGKSSFSLCMIDLHVFLAGSWGEVITIRDICFSSPTVSPFESALLPVDCSFFEIVQITLVYFSTCIISWSLNTYIQWVHHFLFHFSDLVNENCELLFL